MAILGTRYVKAVVDLNILEPGDHIMTDSGGYYEVLSVDISDTPLYPITEKVFEIELSVGDYFYCRDGYCLNTNTDNKGHIINIIKKSSAPKKNEVSDMLSDRAKTHGNFETHAMISQHLKKGLSMGPSYNSLSSCQRESLEMIVHKIARIVNGNPSYQDHWDDIVGYATLAINELGES